LPVITDSFDQRWLLEEYLEVASSLIGLAPARVPAHAADQ